MLLLLLLLLLLLDRDEDSTRYNRVGAGVHLFPLLGYAMPVEDDRGRYLSEGTYNDGKKICLRSRQIF